MYNKDYKTVHDSSLKCSDIQVVYYTKRLKHFDLELINFFFTWN